MSDAIVEIRDYTIEAEWFAAYKVWAIELAAPWLKANLDVIDFWMDDGMEPEVTGSNPIVSPNGQANVCWIIRWPSKAAREEQFGSITSSPEWREIWAKHPNENAYLQMNARFMKAA
ncbi:MAG: hypothetical protein ACR2PZ_24410 [Pseudomonadales bacterium]